MDTNLRLSDIDYYLPDEKIAFFPLDDRDQSKLLVYKDNIIIDSKFTHLSDYLDNNCALIFNDSKVIHARLLLSNKEGAKIELFLIEPVSPTQDFASSFLQTGMVVWKCLIRNAKKFKDTIVFNVEIKGCDGQVESKSGSSVRITAKKGDKVGDMFLVTFMWDNEAIVFMEWLDAFGKIPLPPYIKRDTHTIDEVRYQTIYAQQDGSVAAPTAGLHFSEFVLQSLKDKKIAFANITLHVSAGTFKPITTDLVLEHKMHQEQIIISKDIIKFLLENKHKKIVAVGTTVARTLESIFIMGAKLFLNFSQPTKVEQFEIYENRLLEEVSVEDALLYLQNYLRVNNLQEIRATTSLMILPHYRHKIAKGLITNFHQPKSTLLLLISSYLGEQWRRIYLHAINHGYRFLSYGDSNLYL